MRTLTSRRDTGARPVDSTAARRPRWYTRLGRAIARAIRRLEAGDRIDRMYEEKVGPPLVKLAERCLDEARSARSPEREEKIRKAVNLFLQAVEERLQGTGNPGSYFMLYYSQALEAAQTVRDDTTERAHETFTRHVKKAITDRAIAGEVEIAFRIFALATQYSRVHDENLRLRVEDAHDAYVNGIRYFIEREEYSRASELFERIQVGRFKEERTRAVVDLLVVRAEAHSRGGTPRKAVEAYEAAAEMMPVELTTLRNNDLYEMAARLIEASDPDEARRLRERRSERFMGVKPGSTPEIHDMLSFTRTEE